MSEMIERLARRLFEHGRLEGGIDPDPLTWEAAPAEMQAWIRGHARSMVEEMLSPDTDMKHAGAAALAGVTPGAFDIAHDVYARMIARALN